MTDNIFSDRTQLLQAANRARLSQHCYAPDTPPPDGWRLVETSANFISPQSGFFAALYEGRDEMTGATCQVLAFRGVQGIHDLSSLFSILAARVPPQLNQATAYVEYLQKKRGIDVSALEMTGHSLGGYLARTAGSMAGAKKVWLFNSPGPKASVKKQLERDRPNKLSRESIIHVCSENDIIAHWGYDDGVLMKLKTPTDHHSIRTIVNLLTEQLAQTPVNDNKPAEEKNKNSRSFNAVCSDVSRYVTHSEKVKRLIRKVFHF